VDRSCGNCDEYRCDGNNRLDGRNGTYRLDRSGWKCDEHRRNGSHGVDGVDRSSWVCDEYGSHRSDGLDGVDGSYRRDRLDGVDGMDRSHGLDGADGSDGCHWSDGSSVHGSYGHDGSNRSHGTDGIHGGEFGCVSQLYANGRQHSLCGSLRCLRWSGGNLQREYTPRHLFTDNGWVHRCGGGRLCD